MRQVICWFVHIWNWFVYIGKNPQFTAFLGSNLHTRLAIVTENELGLAFPPRNLPKKFRPDPSTFYLLIVVTNKQTDRQTHRQTKAGKNIIRRESFLGDNKVTHCVRKCVKLIAHVCKTTKYGMPILWPGSKWLGCWNHNLKGNGFKAQTFHVQTTPLANCLHTRASLNKQVQAQQAHSLRKTEDQPRVI